MGQMIPDADPEELGFDSKRLARIDQHFSRYVDDGTMAGYVIAIGRNGKLVHTVAHGARDLELSQPMTTDTLFRIYSMTKPLTSVAAMMLYEKGYLELTDPVGRFIPSFQDQRIFSGGSSLGYTTRALDEPMQIVHLLNHTSGLTYPANHSHPVDALYRAAGLDNDRGTGTNLIDFSERLGGLPLLFQPGTRWNYSLSSDVLGRVVEVVSGLSLDEFLSSNVFEPLGMTDTSFGVPVQNLERLATLYRSGRSSGAAIRDDEAGAYGREPIGHISGGAGLVSSAYDYYRFMQMLLQGGELDGIRLLGSRTIQFMTQNHLPGGVDINEFSYVAPAENRYAGTGFGLGFSVVTDPPSTKVLTQRGEYGWGGKAGTVFWINPAERLTVLFLTQLYPASSIQIRSQLKQLVYQALVD